MDDDRVDLSPQQVFHTAQLSLQQAVFPLVNKWNQIKNLQPDMQTVSTRAHLV